MKRTAQIKKKKKNEIDLFTLCKSNINQKRKIQKQKGNFKTKGRVALETILQKFVSSRDQNLSMRLFSSATPHLCFFKNFKIRKKNIKGASVLGWG